MFCVAGMVDCPGAKLRDVAQKFVPTLFVLLQFVVRRGHTVNREAHDGHRFARLQTARKIAVHLQPLPYEITVCFRNDQHQVRIHAQQRAQCFRIQMVGVLVAGSDDIDEIEALRLDDSLGHANVRLVRVGVFVRKRIRKVRIQQQMAILPFN